MFSLTSHAHRLQAWCHSLKHSLISQNDVILYQTIVLIPLPYSQLLISDRFRASHLHPQERVCVLMNSRVEPSFSVWHMSFFIFWAKRISQPTPNTHTQLHPHGTWPIPARVIPSWTWRALIWYGEWRKEMSGCVVHRMKAWDSMCLWSQHTGGWGRRIAIWEFQAWPCHRKEESRGKKIKTGKGRGEEREGREITMEVFYCYLRRSIVRKFLKSLWRWTWTRDTTKRCR